MTKRLVMCLAGSAAALLGGAHAHADDYGCKVMLCMSNPSGPTAVAECRPPIERLVRERAQARPPAWPTCEEAAPSTMKFGSRPYDQCPAGTTALDSDVQALQIAQDTFSLMLKGGVRSGGSSLTTVRVSALPSGTAVLQGIGEGMVNNSLDKTCVGKSIGTVEVLNGSGDNATSISYPVFGQVVSIAPAASPRVVDILIDGKLFKSTRF